MYIPSYLAPSLETGVDGDPLSTFKKKAAGFPAALKYMRRPTNKNLHVK